MKSLNRRIKNDVLDSLPGTPGVYRFYDETDVLIYVGKAKNLRRRIGQYRNAKRCKAHAKMRKIKAESHRLEWEVCANEFEALALETRLIQEHRPKWNVVGAFHFLYPMVGVCSKEGHFYLCYTLTPDAFPNFRFHGAFRSRDRTREAFFALADLLRLVGHPITKSQVQKSGLATSSLTPISSAGAAKAYVYGFRQISEEWRSRLEAFLCGEDFGAIEDLSLQLLDRPTAIANCKETQEQLYCIRRFWRHEIMALSKARTHSNWAPYPVAQRDRDFIFIALRSAGEYQHSDQCSNLSSKLSIVKRSD